MENSMTKITLEEVGFTAKEIKEIRFMVRSMVSWGEGGCYGDSDSITDKKSFATAKRALSKLNRVIFID